MGFESVRDEYEYCNQYSVRFRVELEKIKTITENEINGLFFLEFKKRKELEQRLAVINSMSDYKERYNKTINKLKEEYIAAGYAENAARLLMDTVEMWINFNKDMILNSKDVGELSAILSCTEDCIEIRNTGKTPSYSGYGELGRLPINGAILYEGTINPHLICSQMAFLYGIAEMIEGKPVPYVRRVYATSVEEYNTIKNKPESMMWLFSHIQIV